MNRHTFIRQSLLAGAALVALDTTRGIANTATIAKEAPFRMKFSPEFGIFKELVGTDIIDQIKWGYDQGFRAWESTWLARRTVEEQERISKTVSQLGMEFGQFVGTMNFKEPTFASRDKAIREKPEILTGR